MWEIGARAAGDAAYWRARAERIVGHALRYRRRLHDEMVSNTKWIWKQAQKTVDLQQRAERAEAAHVRLVEAMKEVQDELSACNESPGGCGYWREAAKCRAGERDALKVRAERAEAAAARWKAVMKSGERVGKENHFLRARAERAEALLREAAEALEWYSACGYEPRFVDDLGYKWNPEEWQYDSPEIMDDKGEKARAALAKVRDLLEGKHDKG